MFMGDSERRRPSVRSRTSAYVWRSTISARLFFAQILRSAPSTAKVDKSFVDSCTQRQNSAKIITAIIGLSERWA